MVHIASLVIEKMQFNHFPIMSMGEFCCYRNQTERQITIILAFLELSFPKQHLYQIIYSALVVLEELSFKNPFFLKV